MLKRYNPELEKDIGLGLPCLTMKTNHIGSWVQYEDFQKLEVELLEAKAQLAELAAREPVIPEGLHKSTSDMVLGFASALAEKLYCSEQKYGWSDGWMDADWQEKCLQDFWHHIGKGDPRDVAAYCAFMWHHGWKTRAAPPVPFVVKLPECVDDLHGIGPVMSAEAVEEAIKAANGSAADE